MCLHCVKILMNLSRSECSGIFMQHQNRMGRYYGVIVVREGGPHSGAACIAPLNIPPHFKTCMRTRVRCFGGIATPRRPPTGLTLAPLTRRSSPLTFAGRALTNGLLHLVVIGQPIGTLQNKVWAQPTTRFPPRRSDVAVPPLQVPAAAPSVKWVILRSRAPAVCTWHHSSRRVRGPSARFGGIASAQKAPDHTRRHAKNNP